MKPIVRWIASAILFVILDFIYINLTKAQFEKQIVEVQRVYMKIKVWPAIICYVFLIFGLNYFILRPHRSVLEAFLLGAVIYGVYDTTNLATIKKWDWKFALMDTVWGGVLMALVTGIIYAF
jgi:uncharacterized membrane protein